MRKASLRAVERCMFKITTDSSPNMSVVGNTLDRNRNFFAYCPDEK